MSSAILGGLTTIAPLFPNYRYRVGILTKMDPFNGSIHVTPSTASIGNGTVGQLLRINTNGTQEFYSQFITTSVTLNFPSTSAASNSDLNVFLNGVVLGDVIALGTPQISVMPNTCYTAFVASANTVTIRHNNYDTLGSRDPLPGVFKITIIK